MHIEDRERLTAERGREIAEKNGYAFYVVLPSGVDAAICKYIHTYGILSELTEWGFGDRWCYHTLAGAIVALGEWVERGGEGEPQNWHRHPSSGRRRPEGDASKEYVNV
jgi:hypothetical protein